MKGQVSFEYFVALMIFITFILFVALQLISKSMPYRRESKYSTLLSEAYQISEILINDPGEPINWDSSNVKRIGLLDETKNRTGLLSRSKIDKLAKMNYQSVANGLGIDTSKYRFSIIIWNSTSVMVNVTNASTSETVAEINRLAVFGREVVNVSVMVW